MNTSWMLLIGALFFAWRLWQRRTGESGAARPSNPPALRSDIRGDEGERRVHEELREALTWLCGENFYLHPGALLLNHAPGTDYPTAEIDHLVITPFGIFIVETKNWTGSIEPGSDSDNFIRTGADGRRETRTSPLRQNRSKVSFLRAVLPALWAIEGIGVFASDHCMLSPSLPFNVMRRTDLRQWLRGRQARHAMRGSPAIDVAKAWAAIRCVADTDDSALRKHRERLRVNPKKLPVLS
jgi:nuclease-like protein